MTTTGRHHGDLAGRLLSAAKAKPPRSAPPAPEAVDYDFATPAAFTAAQLARMAEGADQWAQKVAGAMSAEMRAPVQLSARPVTQHFLAALRDQAPGAAVFCIPLTVHGSGLGGLLVLDGQQARAWVGTLLGGAGQAAPADRPLSQLESSLIFDLVRVLVECLGSLAAESGLRLDSQEQVLQNGQSLAGHEGLEMVQLALASEVAGDRPAVAMLLPADAVAPLAGMAVKKAPAPEQVRQAMLEHIQRAPLGVQVMLGQAQLTVSELAGLAPGDVLVLDRRAGEGADLLAGSLRLFRANPVAKAGHYAVQIVGAVQD